MVAHSLARQSIVFYLLGVHEEVKARLRFLFVHHDMASCSCSDCSFAGMEGVPGRASAAFYSQNFPTLRVSEWAGVRVNFAVEYAE